MGARRSAVLHGLRTHGGGWGLRRCGARGRRWSDRGPGRGLAGGALLCPGLRALALAGYEDFPTRQRQARGKGCYLGIGVANYVEGTGLGPFEGVTVRVLPNGKVAVATGATAQGQGTRTTLSQVVADQIGCRIEDITMTTGDTAAISQGVGAFASRQFIAEAAALLRTLVHRRLEHDHTTDDVHDRKRVRVAMRINTDHEVHLICKHP